MTKPNWFHCNNCFATAADRSGCFTLTSCGHIFCHSCSTEQVPGKCQDCGSDCNSIRLTEDLNPLIQLYFTSPETLLKRHSREMTQVLSFQEKHRDRLFQYLQTQVSRISTLREGARKLAEKLQQLDKENKKLKEQNRILQERSPQPKSISVVYPAVQSHSTQATPVHAFNLEAHTPARDRLMKSGGSVQYMQPSSGQAAAMASRAIPERVSLERNTWHDNSSISGRMPPNRTSRPTTERIASFMVPRSQVSPSPRLCQAFATTTLHTPEEVIPQLNSTHENRSLNAAAHGSLRQNRFTPQVRVNPYGTFSRMSEMTRKMYG